MGEEAFDEVIIPSVVLTRKDALYLLEVANRVLNHKGW